MKEFYVLFAVLVAVTAITPPAPSEADGILTSALNFVRDCGEWSIVLCAKERALRVVDAVDGELKITDGITRKERRI